MWKSSFWVDSSLHLGHNQNGLRQPTGSAGFQTHGFGPWVRKPRLLLVQLPPSTLETSGTSPGKSQHLPTVLGGSKAAAQHAPVPVCSDLVQLESHAEAPV